MKSGIYIITNILNNKKYVGSSTKAEARLRQHKRHLTAGVHPNTHLQASWNKYGESAFLLQTLEFCERGQLLIRESHWVKVLETRDSKKGYNKQEPLDQPIPIWIQHDCESIPVDAYEKYTLVHKGSFSSINEAGRELKVKHVQIQKVVAGEKASAGGYIFKKQGDPPPTEPIKKPGWNSSLKAQPITIQGTEYQHLTQAAEALGIKPSLVYWRVNSPYYEDYNYTNPEFQITKTPRTRAKPGTKPKEVKTPKLQPVEVYKDGQLLDTQPSVRATAEKYNLLPKKISDVLGNRRISHGGYTFKRPVESKGDSSPQEKDQGVPETTKQLS